MYNISMWCGIRLRLGVGLACLAVLLPAGAFAFHYPLRSEEIEQAYSLGQSSDREELASFLQQYERDFSYPSDRPVAYVKSVDFQTPYEQIVLKSMRTSEYDKFKAAEDYRANDGAVFVRVVVALKIGFAGPIPKAESFQVNVSQATPLEPAATATAVLCNPFDPLAVYAAPQPCDAYTREILLRFDHSQFKKGTVTVHVLLPEGKSLEAKFDLDKLK